MRTSVCLCLAVAAAALGCSGSSKPYRTAPVSGRVTLDGKPLADARVSFHPIHDPKAGPLSGPEAHGVTDADGRYSLSTPFGDRGATLGPNRVMISTFKTEPHPTNPDGPHKVLVKERIPNKYFTDQAPLKFDVPAAGSTAAHFDLTSK
jgi:hypothetical protein